MRPAPVSRTTRGRSWLPAVVAQAEMAMRPASAASVQAIGRIRPSSPCPRLLRCYTRAHLPATSENESAMSTVRTETDTFGPIEVAADRYWGAQAQRSLGNFRIGWEKQPLPIVRALGIVKRAAAETNMALGKLDPKLGATIVSAANEVIEGRLNDHFPLVVWQTGSG